MNDEILKKMLEGNPDAIELEVKVKVGETDVSSAMNISGAVIENCIFSVEYNEEQELAIISFDVREQELNGYTPPDPLVVCNIFTRFGLICNELKVKDWCCGRSLGFDYK